MRDHEFWPIKEGKVFEKGTHKELLDKNGYYAGLVKSQLAQDELESKEDNLPFMAKKKSSIFRLSRVVSKNYPVISVKAELLKMLLILKFKLKKSMKIKKDVLNIENCLLLYYMTIS